MKSNNSVLISIITATYNAQTNLSDLILSIKDQKSELIELIIIDGNSNDKTHEILTDQSILIDKFIIEEDDGIYDAWNKGIKLATGSWIMFLGSDDKLFPNILKKLSDLIQSRNLAQFDYICAQNDYINSSNELLKVLGKPWKWSDFRKRMTTAHVGSLHNRKLFDEIGFFDLNFKICADYELLLRKKEKLNTFFINDKIAKMKFGGISFSLKALFETYQIRKLHNTVPNFMNFLLLIWDSLAVLTFRFRH